MLRVAELVGDLGDRRIRELEELSCDLRPRALGEAGKRARSRAVREYRNAIDRALDSMLGWTRR